MQLYTDSSDTHPLAEGDLVDVGRAILSQCTPEQRAEILAPAGPPPHRPADERRRYRAEELQAAREGRGLSRLRVWEPDDEARYDGPYVPLLRGGGYVFDPTEGDLVSETEPLPFVPAPDDAQLASA
ncbi:hypothetical protein GobsT_64260 [Gemmata obscuriglobus]|uniref:Uncharacterized protein n=1 Tax=Gemmata obscuriglobus TaxID=114 RepID=A0A2Z3GYC5_9BACT|nr:hypothetical protein [Gemmata obscuriglobus]AWM35855.1 hypothetical protein C1280_01680 [Gemmata obscuriglobus]QEG31603.1 hypothetical protein GobsT_64260 [Gemmata obscuriglobus]VTS10945.1 unnamed protein product [Gemmata obscuriglobus UQM 2246]